MKEGGGFYGLGSDNNSVIPSGTAYLGQANPGLMTGDIRFALPVAATRVGMYVATRTNVDSGAVMIEACDHDNQVLASIYVEGVHYNSWRSSFVELEADGIEYVWLRGNHASVLRVDDFMFVEIPEPATLSLLTLGFLALLRRRGR